MRSLDSDDTQKDPSVHGHTRLPVLAREHSTLESLSSALHSLSLSTRAPLRRPSQTQPSLASPPTSDSLPLSSSRRPSIADPSHPHPFPLSSSPISPAPFSLSDDPPSPISLTNTHNHTHPSDGTPTTHPNSQTTITPRQFAQALRDAREDVTWASFDSVHVSSWEPPRRLLLLTYPTGLQIWSLHTPDRALEVLNLSSQSSPAFHGISYAAVLPTPMPAQVLADDYYHLRPLIAFVQPNAAEKGGMSLTFYSLRTHEVVKSIFFGRPGAAMGTAGEGCKGLIRCSDKYIVVGISSPPSLHVLSASTLAPLGAPITDVQPHPDTGLPVFDLRTRQLAYASSSPPSNHSSGIITRDSGGAEAPLPGSGIGMGVGVGVGVGEIGAQVGSAAKRVGEGVLSGVRTLGGLGYAYLSSSNSNANSNAAASADEGRKERTQLSRSAPQPGSFLSSIPSRAAGGLAFLQSSGDEWRAGGASSSTGAKSGLGSVCVIDLGSPLGGTWRQTAHFRPSTKPVVLLSLNPAGALLLSVNADGRVFHIYELRPRAPSSPSPSPSPGEVSPPPPPVWHRYALKRGATTASASRASWTPDSRWIAISSLRGTIHVYAISPYGGHASLSTHGGRKLRNSPGLMPLSCSALPLVRFYARPSPATVDSTAGAGATPELAFEFLPHQTSVASQLIPWPHPSPNSPTIPIPLPSRSPQSPRSIPVLPSRRPSSSSSTSIHPPTSDPTPNPLSLSHFQDLLVFSPTDAHMSLQRCTLSPALSNLNPSASTTHISTPTSSSGTPSSTRTPSSSFSSQRIPNLSSLITAHGHGTGVDDLLATGVNVANWSLGRERGWPEVKHVLFKPSSSLNIPARHLSRNATRAGWLANAEIETCSQSTKMLPGSVYQAHQFDFFTLPSGYLSKLRNHDLDLPSTKIEVRQEIQVRPARQNAHDVFLEEDEDAPDQEQSRSVASSFDEPIASAMHTILDAKATSSVIPTYPNASSPRQAHWLDSGPIRSVATSLHGGVNEGIGRLRREISRARTPRPRPLSENYDDSLRIDTENDLIRVGFSGHAAPHMHREEDEWEGAEDQDYRQAVDNDRFDDLIVGLLDEEEEERRALAAQLQEQRAGRSRNRASNRP